MIQLNGTYKFDSFELELVNPFLEVVGKLQNVDLVNKKFSIQIRLYKDGEFSKGIYLEGVTIGNLNATEAELQASIVTRIMDRLEDFKVS